ncbi:MAG: DUF2103 domain-containing protein [Halobacteriales archaeon]
MSTPGRDYCGTCSSSLEKPGDYCLVCRNANADALVIEAGEAAATITVLNDEATIGETTVTTTPEGGRRARTQQRNFAGRIVDESRRRRPESVYMAGERDTLRRVRADLAADCYRIDVDDPIAGVLARREDRDLEVVDAPPAELIGGSHSTLVGGRSGERVIRTVAGHPHVKKVVPGPIDAGGSAGGGVRAKVTRADENGNLRLLIRDGSSVQTNRVVTTAMDRNRGERVGDDLTEALAGD